VCVCVCCLGERYDEYYIQQKEVERRKSAKQRKEEERLKELEYV